MTIDNATKWLRGFLMEDRFAEQVKIEADRAGVRPAQLEAAADKLGVRVGPGPIWFIP